MSEWFQEARFWDGMGSFMFTKERWAAAPEQMALAVERLGIEAGATVLDLGCGPGRNAVALRDLGMAVTGVDLHEAYLAQARERAPDIEWVADDMRRFERPGAFDAAVNLYSTFGYFEDPEDDLLVLRRVRASLKSGAKLLLDTMSKEVLAKKFQARMWLEHPEGGIVVCKPHLVDGWRAMKMTWCWIRDGKEEEHTFFQRLYAGTELEALARRAGFARAESFGWFDGSPYDHEARRLVMVATAP